MTGTAPHRTPRTQLLLPRMAAIASTTANPATASQTPSGSRASAAGVMTSAHTANTASATPGMRAGGTSQATTTEAIAMTTIA